MSTVTMQDVADLAGVSSKTVSRVINNEPRVNPATREKIERIIDELNFQPNKSAQGLAADRSLLLGLLYDNPSPSYVTGLQEGVLRACNNFGYGLVIHPCNHSDESFMPNLKKLINSSRVDGVVLTPPLTENKEVLDFLVANKKPYVLISPLVHQDESQFVFSDDVVAAREVMQHLIEFGHRRIGFIFGVRHRSGSEMRYQGYKLALEENAIAYDESLIAEGDFTFESGAQAAHQLLRLEKPPTAIFACNDYMAAGVLKTAYQLRISVPYELSVCGFDDNPIACYVTPTLTSVRHPVESLAENAGELLIKQLKKYTPEAEQPVIQSQLIPRESTGPALGELK